MDCRQFKDPVYALGQAVNLLRHTKPFTSYHFGRLSNVLMGQIRRKHYVFTFDGDRPVGYAGWALCEEPVARAWIENRHVPSFAECDAGDCVVGITFYAETTKVCLFQARWCRNLYPNAKVFGIRDYGSRERSTQLRNRVKESSTNSARESDRPETAIPIDTGA